MGISGQAQPASCVLKSDPQSEQIRTSFQFLYLFFFFLLRFKYQFHVNNLAKDMSLSLLPIVRMD